jgi:hypothetical protein
MIKVLDPSDSNDLSKALRAKEMLLAVIVRTKN